MSWLGDFFTGSKPSSTSTQTKTQKKLTNEWANQSREQLPGLFEGYGNLIDTMKGDTFDKTQYQNLSGVNNVDFNNTPGKFNLEEAGGIGLPGMTNLLNNYQAGNNMPTAPAERNSYGMMNPWESSYQDNVISAINRQRDNNITDMNASRGGELYSRARQANEQDIRNDTLNTVANLLNQQYNVERGMENSSLENMLGRSANIYGQQLNADTSRYMSGLGALSGAMDSANQTALGGYNTYADLYSNLLNNDTQRQMYNSQFGLDRLNAMNTGNANYYNQMLGAFSGLSGLMGTPLGVETKAIIPGQEGLLSPNNIMGVGGMLAAGHLISDKRVKKDVSDLNVGIEFINKVRPVSFKYINGDDEIEMGVIAQEIQEIQEDWMNVVDESNPDLLKVDYGKFIMPLIKSVQDLSAEITELKEVVNGTNNTETTKTE